MEIKILGGGCPKCKRLEKVARSAAEEAGIKANFIKVTEMIDIMAYDVSVTPGLVIGGEVKSTGRIPAKAEIVAWIQEAIA